MVYDLTDKESFKSIDDWMNEVEKHASDNVSRILVGNKNDLTDQRQVTEEEGRELADHYNIRFLETSAKESMNVEEAFTLMTKEIKSRVVHTDTKKPVATGGKRLGGGETKRVDKKKDNGCGCQ